MLLILSVDFRECLIVFLEKKTHLFQDRIFISFSTSFFLAALPTLKNNSYMPAVAVKLMQDFSYKSPLTHSLHASKLCFHWTFPNLSFM